MGTPPKKYVAASLPSHVPVVAFVLLTTGSVLLAGCSSEIVKREEVSLELVEAGVLDEWPLTVDRADVECRQDEVVTLRADGETFAFNGRARELTWHERDWRHATAIAALGEGSDGWTPALLDLLRYAERTICG